MYVYVSPLTRSLWAPTYRLHSRWLPTTCHSLKSYPTPPSRNQFDVGNFINGEVKESSSKEWIDVRSPATQKLVCRVPRSTNTEVWRFAMLRGRPPCPLRRLFPLERTQRKRLRQDRHSSVASDDHTVLLYRGKFELYVVCAPDHLPTSCRVCVYPCPGVHWDRFDNRRWRRRLLRRKRRSCRGETSPFSTAPGSCSSFRR